MIIRLIFTRFSAKNNRDYYIEMRFYSMKVNIYDVAKAANVSIATVSKVINNTGRIGDKTRKKVNDVIKELDYKPNLMASALMGKKTCTIGFILPDLANPFFSELARYVEDMASSFNYNVVICSTDYITEKEEMYVSLLLQKNVDGFILASGFESFEAIEKIQAMNIPIVLVARNAPGKQLNLVSINDYDAGFRATSYLIERGHQQIAIIARNIWSNRERYRGYADAMRKNGLVPMDEHYYAKESTIQDGFKSLQQIMKVSPIKPTAFFACNDLMATGAIKACKKLNLKVPEDISIIGFDNSIFAQIVEPALTTVEQPQREIATEAVQLLMNAINGDNAHQTITLKTKIIERETVKNLIL